MIPEQVQQLIDEFSRLPGIGPESAERLTFYLLKQPEDRVTKLGETVRQLKEGIQYCNRCCNLATTERCVICEDPSREQEKVCVVEDPLDVMALESTGAYKGLYHVLQGAISPLDGIGPEQLTIHQFMLRFDDEPIREVILATNPTVTGEATAVYLTRQMGDKNVTITHLAQGIPMGGQLEFADPDTLRRALQGRREVYNTPS